MKKIIRYKDRQFFCSDDNWKHFEKLERRTVDAKEEMNSDIITRVKFRYELGEERASIILAELDKIREDFALQFDDGYGHAFEVFAISVLYNLDYKTTYSKYIVVGNGDGKTDAIYWNDDDKVTLYQVKLDMMEQTDITIIKKNYLEFVREGTISSNDCNDLLRFCNKHKKSLTSEKDYEIYTISNNLRENNYTPKQICDLYYENLILCKNNHIKLKLTIPKKQNGNFYLARVSDIVYAYFQDAKSFVSELIDCDSINCKENLYKFFYDNVRGDLGINENMKDTIQYEPTNFVKYNNGITITGEVEYKETTGVLLIKNPIINNGQQTIWNLANQYPNIENINLLIFVKNDSDFTTKSKIARFTNEQKNITPLDLLSLDRNVRALQEKIFKNEDSNFFLELNSSGKRNYSKAIKKIYGADNIISLADFCKLYFSTEDLQLGKWKSNVSVMINSILNQSRPYDFEKAINICKVIKNAKQYMKNVVDPKQKNNLKAADLAFMFIIYRYRLSEKRAHKVIEKLNERYYYNVPDSARKSKLIDIYKSNSVVKQIEEIINSEVETNNTVEVVLS